MRLDKVLVERGHARSRSEAEALIDQQMVCVNGKFGLKASAPVDEETAEIEITGEVMPFVSRGGQKLAAALEKFHIDPAGKQCLDAGASTGGFTDCLLQGGAAHVFAIDVGRDQMVPQLRDDPRVTLRERVNVRDLTPAMFPAPFALIVADLSFISLTLAFPALAPLLTPDGDMICLVKPQFEVGAERIGKGGIVRSPQLRTQALARVVAAAYGCGLAEFARMQSPIRGGDGNEEFLLHLRPVATVPR